MSERINRRIPLTYNSYKFFFRFWRKTTFIACVRGHWSQLFDADSAVKIFWYRPEYEIDHSRGFVKMDGSPSRKRCNQLQKHQQINRIVSLHLYVSALICAHFYILRLQYMIKKSSPLPPYLMMLKLFSRWWSWRNNFPTRFQEIYFLLLNNSHKK